VPSHAVSIANAWSLRSHKACFETEKIAMTGIMCGH
jgi:hypothetical protein